MIIYWLINSLLKVYFIKAEMLIGESIFLNVGGTVFCYGYNLYYSFWS